MKGYTSRQQIENYLLITVDPSFYTQINSWIEQIETYIDKTTGRNFIADTVASAKLYDGDGTSELLIDDCVDVTEVKIDDDVLVEGTDEDYLVYPANDLPKTKIKLLNDIFSHYNRQTISITGKWGYSVAVPTDITMVATVLVAGMVNYSLNAEGEIKSRSIGTYSVTFKDEKQWQDFDRVQKVLDYYKKYKF